MPPTEQPVIPSDRVTEAELLDLEGRAAVGWWREEEDCPSGETVARLLREIRRYRALLLGLTSKPCPVVDFFCWWCHADLKDPKAPHNEGCPWPPLEAEVQAIKDER